MNLYQTTARWAVLSRWIAYVTIGAVLAMGYSAFKPAAAQEKRAIVPPGKAAEPAPVEKAADDKTVAKTLTAEEANKLADAMLAAPEPKKDDKAQEGASQRKTTLTDEVKKILDEEGGWLHFLAPVAILFVSVIAVAFAIERAIGLRRSKVVPSDLMAALRALASQKGGFDPRQAYRICRQSPSAAATVIKVMLQKVGRPLPEIEHAVTEASEREASRLYANVRWQNLAFNVAPMLGLAGTVYGMIIAFFRTANMPLGQNKMESLATGIYLALFATLAGLVVAIPAGVLDHLFEGRILKLFREIDDVVHAMLPQLERFEGRPRGVKNSQAEAAAATAEPVAAEVSEEPKGKWPVVTPKAQ
jgi:biopolymer transport protein ExbB